MQTNILELHEQFKITFGVCVCVCVCVCVGASLICRLLPLFVTCINVSCC